METTKVFVNAENMATFSCPKCMKTSIKDVTKYALMEKAVRIKYKCSCGHTHSVLLERRRHYRKETDLSGQFSSSKTGKGMMIVKDLSRFGLKFEALGDYNFELGKKVQVMFHLDDSHSTEIRKDVIIRNRIGRAIGAEFLRQDDSELSDRRLGFYLMP
jgi:hypothetical protein